MLAEVWGHLLRKLKTEYKARAAELLVQSLGTEQEAEFVTWCVVEATRAKQAQGIYTTATELIGPILQKFFDAETDDSRRIFLLLRRVLTALLHHSKTESFVVVAGIVVASVDKELKSGEGGNAAEWREERLIRAIEVVTVLCAVRKGAKLTCEFIITLSFGVVRLISCYKLPSSRRFWTLSRGYRPVWH